MDTIRSLTRKRSQVQVLYRPPERPGQTGMRAWRRAPVRDETGVVSPADVVPHWCREPVGQTDAGALRHPELLLRARVSDSLTPGSLGGTPPRMRGGGAAGGHDRESLRGSRRAQRHGDG